MGEVFAGRYELVDLIGEGGTGSVWRVWDAREERLVAAKVLRQSDAVSLLRFVREQAVRIDHPHVLTPLGWAGEDDRVLFTMPVVDGGSVATLVGDHGALPPRLVAELLRQLLDALAAVHEAGILHRDLKPANLLLQASGVGRPHLHLTDFGIAVDLHGPRFTRTGAWTGTPGYLAPEVVDGAEPHPTSDLYAVGRVAQVMLTGLRPVDAAVRPPGVPTSLWSLAESLADPDPGRRPQSAAQARARLDGAELTFDETAMGDVEVLRQIADPPRPVGPPVQSPVGPPVASRVQPPDAPVVEAPSTRGVSRGRWVVASMAVAAVIAGLLAWSPWSGPGVGADGGAGPLTATTGPAATTGEVTPTTAPTAATTSPTTSTQEPSATSGGVGVGPVIVSVGQPCGFSDVGIDDETIDGVEVRCQLRDDGAYAWDAPPP